MDLRYEVWEITGVSEAHTMSRDKPQNAKHVEQTQLPLVSPCTAPRHICPNDYVDNDHEWMFSVDGSLTYMCSGFFHLVVVKRSPIFRLMRTPMPMNERPDLETFMS